MPYISDCSCNNPNTLHCSNITQNCLPVQCKRCGKITEDDKARQKRIWKASRVPSSLYVMNLGALTVTGSKDNRPTQANSFVNWNQSSDRAIPSGSEVDSKTNGYIPTRGNSVRGTITSNKPGGMGPGGPRGVGVDIKHNSYHRYLARKKAKNIVTTKAVSVPKYGNKVQSFGLVRNSGKCTCNELF
mgnify:CR=1 FL=1